MHPDTEAYLNGELKGEALRRFEAELSHNAALREEVELLRPVLRDLQQAALSQKIKTALQNQAKRRRMLLYISVVVFSIFIGLATVGWFYFGKQENPAPKVSSSSTSPSEATIRHIAPDLQDTASKVIQQPVAKNTPDNQPKAGQTSQYLAIAQQHYEVPSEFGNLRGPEAEEAFKEAKNAFSEKKYAEVLRLLEINALADSPEAQYLKAHVLFQQGKFKQSMRLFDAVAVNDKIRILHAPAKWYALLATLASGRSANAQTRLQEILSEQDPTYSSEAEKLAAALAQIK